MREKKNNAPTRATRWHSCAAVPNPGVPERTPTVPVVICEYLVLKVREGTAFITQLMMA
jgi:hypothetical protein